MNYGVQHGPNILEYSKRGTEQEDIFGMFNGHRIVRRRVRAFKGALIVGIVV